jgi:hypothetical protein
MIQRYFIVCEVEITLIQYILFALEENAIYQCSKPEDPSTVPNPHQFGPPTSILRRYRRKEKKLLTSTHETARAKVERLRSGRYMHGDQKTTTRYAMTLSKPKGLISLLAPIKYY